MLASIIREIGKIVEEHSLLNVSEFNISNILSQMPSKQRTMKQKKQAQKSHKKSPQAEVDAKKLKGRPKKRKGSEHISGEASVKKLKISLAKLSTELLDEYNTSILLSPTKSLQNEELAGATSSESFHNEDIPIIRSPEAINESFGGFSEITKSFASEGSAPCETNGNNSATVSAEVVNNSPAGPGLEAEGDCDSEDEEYPVNLETFDESCEVAERNQECGDKCLKGNLESVLNEVNTDIKFFIGDTPVTNTSTNLSIPPIFEEAPLIPKEEVSVDDEAVEDSFLHQLSKRFKVVEESHLKLSTNVEISINGQAEALSRMSDLNKKVTKVLEQNKIIMEFITNLQMQNKNKEKQSLKGNQSTTDKTFPISENSNSVNSHLQKQGHFEEESSASSNKNEAKSSTLVSSSRQSTSNMHSVRSANATTGLISKAKIENITNAVEATKCSDGSLNEAHNIANTASRTSANLQNNSVSTRKASADHANSTLSPSKSETALSSDSTSTIMQSRSGSVINQKSCSCSSNGTKNPGQLDKQISPPLMMNESAELQMECEQSRSSHSTLELIKRSLLLIGNAISPSIYNKPQAKAIACQTSDLDTHSSSSNDHSLESIAFPLQNTLHQLMKLTGELTAQSKNTACNSTGSQSNGACNNKGSQITKAVTCPSTCPQHNTSVPTSEVNVSSVYNIPSISPLECNITQQRDVCRRVDGNISAFSTTSGSFITPSSSSYLAPTLAAPKPPPVTLIKFVNQPVPNTVVNKPTPSTIFLQLPNQTGSSSAHSSFPKISYSPLVEDKARVNVTSQTGSTSNLLFLNPTSVLKTPITNAGCQNLYLQNGSQVSSPATYKPSPATYKPSPMSMKTQLVRNPVQHTLVADEAGSLSDHENKAPVKVTAQTGSTSSLLVLNPTSLLKPPITDTAYQKVNLQNGSAPVSSLETTKASSTSIKTQHVRKEVLHTLIDEEAVPLSDQDTVERLKFKDKPSNLDSYKTKGVSCQYSNPDSTTQNTTAEEQMQLDLPSNHSITSHNQQTMTLPNAFEAEAADMDSNDDDAGSLHDSLPIYDDETVTDILKEGSGTIFDDLFESVKNGSGIAPKKPEKTENRVTKPLLGDKSSSLDKVSVGPSTFKRDAEVSEDKMNEMKTGTKVNDKSARTKESEGSTGTKVSEMSTKTKINEGSGEIKPKTHSEKSSSILNLISEATSQFQNERHLFRKALRDERRAMMEAFFTKKRSGNRNKEKKKYKKKTL